MKQHALLSPSGASRWLNCPPSARLEESFKSVSNDAADEGTLAHNLCELYLRNHFKLLKTIEYNRDLKKIKNNKYYNAEMNGHCLDYVTFILEKYNELKDPTILIEEKIDLTEFIPEGFGTVDCKIIADDLLDINDFKYGKGVLVDAHKNSQMMLYALGALKKSSLLYNIKMVRITIFQPRLNNYSSYEISAKDLLTWGEEYVKPNAELAFKGKGEYKAGSHCKFCKARNQCKTLADHNMDLAKYAFEDPNKLTDQDISDILEKVADFKVWINNISSYALNEAINNEKQWPGFKLVAGRSNRKYLDEIKIRNILEKTKLPKSSYLSSPELLGIGALEKNIGKIEVDKLVGKYIVKPPGAPTLVPEWDKRPKLNSSDAAKIAFEDIEDT